VHAAKFTAYFFSVTSTMSCLRFLPALALIVVTPTSALAAPPAAPTNLVASSEISGELNLTWEDNAEDEAYSVIQFRVPPATTWNSVQGNYPPDTENAFLTGGNPGTTFEFRIRAYNVSNEFSESNIATIVALDAVNSPRYAEILVSVPFSYQVVATAARGSAIASYSATGLPNGLTIDETSGQISGTPTEDGYFPTVILVHYADILLPPAKGNLALRIPPVPGPPVVTADAPQVTLAAGALASVIDLDTRFHDPDTKMAVRMDTNQGSILVSLYDRAAPIPVENFLHYVDAAGYTNNLFHRSVNAATFDIIQSGSFSVNGADLSSVPTVSPIVNSPGIPNDRGTLALARTSSPNSATSGWYFNANDSPGLDVGDGYSVFGRATTVSLPVIDAIFNLPTVATSFLVDGILSSAAFATVPTTNGSAPDGTNLVVVQQIARISSLAYVVASNSRQEVADAEIIDGDLRLTPISPGSTDIGITVTDIDGNSITGSVSVTVLENFASWSTIHAGGAGPTVDGEPDGATNALEYALGGDPSRMDASEILPVGGTMEANGNTHLTLAFSHLKNAGDLTYVAEKSSDLKDWTTIWESSDGFTHPDIVSTVDLADSTFVTVRDPAAMAVGAQMHLRLRVEIDGATPP
jgi:peptidyl-prolyl cis-trans isomerase A (cyclophilin A)